MPRQRRKSSRRGKAPAAEITLDISDIATGGKGLGWHEGRPVFAPYTLPGERVTAQITGERGQAVYARGLRLLAASADRVKPRCSHFGSCWGCQWQHIDYPAQLLLKQDLLAEQLSRHGQLPDELIERAMQPVLPAESTWEYDHSLRLRRDKTGAWGLPREDRSIEPIAECPRAHPALLKILRELELDYPAAKRLTLRRGSDGRLMLIVELEREIAPDLGTDLPLSVNLILPDREPVNLIGEAQSHFEIAGQRFRVTAGSAIRDNFSGMNQLCETVMQLAQPTRRERALDLYAGVGIFAALLAQRAALVTLVESYPPAANDAEANLSAFDNVDIIEGSVEEVLADMVAEAARYDVAVLDPPSRGLSKEIIARLPRLGLQRLVYASGDPASLARDSRNLIEAGYRLRVIQPIDLAPQTWYITAVALFTLVD